MVLPSRQLREARPTLALALLFPLFVAPVGLFVTVAARQVTQGNSFEAGLGLAFAAAFVLLYVVCAVFLLGNARRPGVIARTETVPLSASAEVVRARIRASASASRRIVHEDAEHMIVLLGPPVASARMRGTIEPSETPLRVDIALTPADGYRVAPSATIVVRELVTSSEPAVEHAATTFASLVG